MIACSSVWDSMICLQQLFAEVSGLMGSRNNVTLVLSRDRDIMALCR